MTPNWFWFADYKPYVVPIQLANNHIIHSAGKGSIIFHPVVNGKTLTPVQIHHVLHVPDLGSNLLSVLYLVKHQNFLVTIFKNTLTFHQNDKLYFTATIDPWNVAYLDGHTQLGYESAKIATQKPNFEFLH